MIIVTRAMFTVDCVFITGLLVKLHSNHQSVFWVRLVLILCLDKKYGRKLEVIKLCERFRGLRASVGCIIVSDSGVTIQVTWLILPVVICLSQRLSHACLSISLNTVKLRTAHYISYSLFDGFFLQG